MKIDKDALFDERGNRCECGCGKVAHDAHHALIHRMKRFPELDAPENLILVNHDEHILRKFDNQAWRKYFWQVQIDRYGYEHMMEWLNNLPAKIDRSRFDFVERKTKMDYISIYEFKNAPAEWKALSPHGGDEDWLAFVPDSMTNKYVPFLEEGRFGNDVSEHKVNGGFVLISAHA